MAICHPDREAYRTNGLCSPCYQKARKYKDLDFAKLLLEQNNRCKICNEEFLMRDTFQGMRTTANIDHNHVTGVTRGILCHRCNIIVGYIESPFYEATLAYLRSYE
jgi:hypothetical protein